MTIQQGGKIFVLKGLIIFFGILLVSGQGLSQTNDCGEAGRQLQGNFEVIQTKGGLWGYFERATALKDRSFLGMQADSKLQRAVMIFKEQCSDQSTPPPTPALFKKIGDVLDEARIINNKSVNRTPPEKIVTSVQELIKNLDNLIKSAGQ
ncbi:MAG: hypothetical protein ACE5G9_09295 [Nitrospinales bacterium]